MKILFITNEIPYFTGGGTPIRQYNLLKILANDHEFTVLCFDYQEPTSIIKVDEISHYCKRVVLVAKSRILILTRIQRKIATIKQLIDPHPYIIHEFASDAMKTQVEMLLNTESFNIVHIDNIEMGPLIEGVGKIKCVVGYDAISPKLKQYFWIERDTKRRIYRLIEWAKFMRYEKSIYRNADLCTMTSDLEKDNVLKLVPEANVIVVPNGVDTSYFQPTITYRNNESKYILFVGSLSYLPNQDAVLYFYRNVWPILKQHFPNLNWIIVGRYPPPEIQALETVDVKVIGWVNDVRTFMQNGLAMIVPLRSGSGTRIKILESLAAGLPVISTTLGAEGLNITHGKNILLADTPNEFIKAVNLLINQPDVANAIRINGRRLVEEQYDWRTIAKRLNEAYESLFNG